jgi:hypothetical protein
MKKYQGQVGYATIITIFIILGAITILGFVIETGRAMDAAGRLSGGSDLSARSGAIQFAKTTVLETKKEYEIIEKKMEEEIEEEGLLEKDTEEFKEEVKKRSTVKLQAKLGNIKNKAKNACLSKVNAILGHHKLERESVSCNQDEVRVKAFVNYSPIIGESGASGEKFIRESKHTVQIVF